VGSSWAQGACWYTLPKPPPCNQDCLKKGVTAEAILWFKSGEALPRAKAELVFGERGAIKCTVQFAITYWSSMDDPRHTSTMLRPVLNCLLLL